jgi:hypothetical protein
MTIAGGARRRPNATTGAGPRVAAALALALALAALASCSTLSLGAAGTARLALESADGSVTLRPDFEAAVFRSEDHNSVHLYLTDLPELASEAPPPNPTGNLLHIHMFLYPKAGRTPIDFTASNCTITHVVLSDGAIGVYRGGGFLLPSGRPARSFGGRLADATLRPAAATPAFRDLLGWSELTGKVNARRDEERAERLDAIIRSVTRNPALRPVDAEPPDALEGLDGADDTGGIDADNGGEIGDDEG